MSVLRGDTRGALPRLRGRRGRNSGGEPLRPGYGCPPRYLYRLCSRNMRQRVARENDPARFWVPRFCSQGKFTFANLDSSQALGNSREPPAFRFSGPNSRRDKNRVVTRHAFKRLPSTVPTVSAWQARQRSTGPPFTFHLSPFTFQSLTILQLDPREQSPTSRQRVEVAERWVIETGPMNEIRSTVTHHD